MAQPSPLSPAWQRAQALADSGDLAGARAVLERAVELGKVNLSEDDPDVLRTSYLLAGVHQQADDPSAARRVLEAAYAAGQWRLGDADPLMVEISHDIGVVAEELGNRHEARKAFGRVAEFGPSVLGAQHRAVARARAYLGQEQTPSVRTEAAPQPQPAAPPAQAAPSTPYDTRQPSRPAAQPGRPEAQPQWPAAPDAPRPDRPEPPAGPQQPTWPPTAETRAVTRADPPGPDQRTAQMGATPAAFEEGTATHPVVPPERTTHIFGAIPRAPGPGLVQPPSPANQQVWTAPAETAPGRPPDLPNPIDEATVAHPIITPRTTPEQHDTRIRQQPGQAPGPPAYPGSPGDSAQASGLLDFFGSPVDPARLPKPLVVAPPYQREQPGRPPYEKRGMGLFAAIAAVLAAIIAVAALVFVLANRGDDQPSDPNVPTLGGKEPTAVRLRDEGSKIGITWQDPSAGTVSFMVAMGHPGEQLKPVATLGPGQTSYEMGALNTALNYCFTVIAVYRGNQFATSAQTCTDRPAPSTSK